MSETLNTGPMAAAQRPTLSDPAASQADWQRPTAGDICIPNINTAERRKRLAFGGLSLAVALGALAAMVAAGISRWWRAPLFFLFGGAASGFFQWRDKTCVGLASRNERKLGDSAETIQDAAELAQVKQQARRVQVKSFAAALPLTILALLLP